MLSIRKQYRFLFVVAVAFSIFACRMAITTIGKDAFNGPTVAGVGFSVVFNNNGGDTEAYPSTALARPNEPIEGLPSINPQKADFIFAGWYTTAIDQNTVFIGTEVISKNMIVYAKWVAEVDPDNATVFFDKNGGNTDANPPSITVQKGAPTGLPTIDPTKTRLSFIGWYSEPDGSGVKYTGTEYITANRTVYAKWVASNSGIANPVTVSFDDLIEGIPNTMRVYPDMLITNRGTPLYSLPRNPVWSGHVFTGWFLSTPDQSYPFDYHAAIMSDKIVYAGWMEEPTLTDAKIVVFNRNSGDTDSFPKVLQADVNDILQSLPSVHPTKHGYDFRGWWTEETGGSEFTAGMQVTSPITFLYAHWAPTVELTVYFAWNNAILEQAAGSPYYIEARVVKGEASGLPRNPVDSSGTFVFDGWFLDNGSSQSAVYSGAENILENTTVYARWTSVSAPNTIKVMFNKNGGDTLANHNEVNTAIGETLRLFPWQTPTKTGSYFVGWCYDEIGSQPFDPTAVIATTPNPLTLYAKYVSADSVDKYVFFNSSLAEVPADPSFLKVGVNSKLSVMPNVPERTGYVFDGWYTGQNSTGIQAFPNGLDTTFDNNTTVYAHWSRDDSKFARVDFDKNSSAATEPAPLFMEVLKNTKLPGYPSSPERSGYIFKGWYDNDLLVTLAAYTVTSNVTLKAKWEAVSSNNSWVIVYSNPGGSSLYPTLLSNDPNYNVTLRNMQEERDGYYFSGWQTEGGVTYKGGAEMQASVLGFNDSTPEITLTAVWMQPFMVTFNRNNSDLNGWTDASPTTIPINPETNKVKGIPDVDPTRDSYTFLGWYSDPGCNVRFTTSTEIFSNTTVYAKWSTPVDVWLVKYFYAGNKAADDTAALTGNSTSLVTLRNIPSITAPERKVFSGWSTVDASENYTYTGGQEVSAQTLGFSTTNPEVKLYAIWKDAIVVTFDSNGGSEISPNIRPLKSDFTVLNFPDNPTKEDFVFGGWHVENVRGDLLTALTVVAESVTVVAKWNVAYPTVTFDGDGAVTEANPQYITVSYGETVTLPAIPVKPNSSFLGWYTAKNGNGNRFTNSTPVTDHVTVYAMWGIPPPVREPDPFSP
jgi:uncharacterized repeat protein (TIGR02543 family)